MESPQFLTVRPSLMNDPDQIAFEFAGPDPLPSLAAAPGYDGPINCTRPCRQACQLDIVDPFGRHWNLRMTCDTSARQVLSYCLEPSPTQ